MDQYLYHYRATVDRVIDGDSVRFFIDLGFRVQTVSVNCRLHGIEAPECRGDTYEAGMRSKQALEDYLRDVDEIVVASEALDKYGRPLVTIFVRLGETWWCVNDMMLLNDYADVYV